MIKTKKLNGEEIYLNERNIQWIESVPETLITFLNGEKIKVMLSIEECVEKINQSYESALKSDS